MNELSTPGSSSEAIRLAGEDRIMTREEHLQWAKQRAFEYLDKGEIANAYASFYSDTDKHPELKYDGFIKGIGLLAHSDSADSARRFIEGFN